MSPHTCPQAAIESPSNREQRRHPGRPALSPAEAAIEVGVSRSFIYAEMSAGRLASRHAGRRRLILRSDLDAWLEALPAA